MLGGAGAAALAAAVPIAWPQRAAASTRPRVVIVGSGLAGLGCAYRLWRGHGLRSEVYEYNAHRIGGRVQTLRGFFDGGQYAEQHGEFISSEHTADAQARHRIRAAAGQRAPVPPAHQARRTTGCGSAAGSGPRPRWTVTGTDGPGAVPRRGQQQGAVADPVQQSSAWGRRWDHMPATEWIDKNIPGGRDSDFGQLCAAILLDEYGGPVEEQSALNLVYLLGFDDSTASGLQPKTYPELSGTDEKWHIHGGNDQVISGLARRLPPGSIRLGERLVALRARGQAGFTCTFSSGCGHP